jgi:hypothetical protein
LKHESEKFHVFGVNVPTQGVSHAGIGFTLLGTREEARHACVFRKVFIHGVSSKL